MNIMIQPAVAQQFFGNALLSSQGLLSRFLPVRPKTKAGTRMYVIVDLDRDQANLAYRKRVTDILSVPLPLKPGERNVLEPRVLLLSPEGHSKWIRFHDHIEEQLGEGKKLATIRGFGSKAAEHVLRVAGTLTLFDNIAATKIPAEWVEAAIEIVQFHIKECLRIAESAKIDDELTQAQRLYNWACQYEFVYLRKIYHEGPSGIRDKKTATRLVGILVDHGWLREVEDMSLDGARRQGVFKVIKEGIDYHGLI